MENRTNIQIPTPTTPLAAWLYPSPTPSKTAIILAHGLGATKELKLATYATHFQKAGHTVLVFDYRCNGESSGQPRALVDWNMQQEDWRSAISYARSLPIDEVALFGTSFSGGHVIQVAAEDGGIKAVISQCPFTDGVASSRCVGVRALPGLIGAGIWDICVGANVKLVGGVGEVALMNAADVMGTFPPLIPEGYDFQNEIPARIVLKMPFLRPGGYARKVKCPILFGVCGRDSVAPAGPTMEYAKMAPRGVVKFYEDVGHFEIYYGKAFEVAMKDYLEFLEVNLA